VISADPAQLRRSARQLAAVAETLRVEAADLRRTAARLPSSWHADSGTAATAELAGLADALARAQAEFAAVAAGLSGYANAVEQRGLPIEAVPRPHEMAPAWRRPYPLASDAADAAALMRALDPIAAPIYLPAASFSPKTTSR